MTTGSQPVRDDISEDVHEPDERHDVRDTRVNGISDSALDGREDRSARDTHDQDTGSATRVAAEIGGAEREDGGVHAVAWGRRTSVLQVSPA